MGIEERKPKFWFYLLKTKYKWLYGWSRPARMEGWIVLFAYGLLAIGGVFVEPGWVGPYYALLFVAYSVVLGLKGEKPSKDGEID